MNVIDAIQIAGWQGLDVCAYESLPEWSVGEGQVRFIFLDNDDRFLALEFGWGSSGPYLDLRAFVDGAQVPVDALELMGTLSVRPKG